MVVSLVKHKSTCNIIANQSLWDKKHGDLRRQRAIIRPDKYRELYLKLEQCETLCTCGVIALSDAHFSGAAFNV